MKGLMKYFHVLVGNLVFSQCLFAQFYTTNQTPLRILLNLTDKPAQSMAVTWRTIGPIDSPRVQFAIAPDWTEFGPAMSSVNGQTEMVLIDSIQSVYHHSAIIKELFPNTLYIYRVGSDDEWSEWNQFRTADDHNAPFEFVFFGDPQEGIKEYVPRIFRKGFSVAPDARFWLFTGDLIPIPEKDKYWHEWFLAGGFVFSMVPSIMTPGSHEYYYRKADRTKVHEFTRFWNAHFTLPENGVAGLGERSYYVDYQGVRIIMLDGQSKRDEQSGWMDNLLKNNPNKWTIAAVHQPVFSMGRDRDEKDTHDAFMYIFDKYGVDLVLTGHDHVYARSHKLFNGEVVGNDDYGTVYVISVSGAKSYPLSFKYGNLMKKTGQNMQLFQVISINDDTLAFKSYTVTGKLYDAFELQK